MAADAPLNIVYHGEWENANDAKMRARNAIEAFCKRREITPGDNVQFHVLRSSQPGEFAIVAPPQTPAHKVLPENLGLGVSVFNLPPNCNKKLVGIDTKAVFSRIANIVRATPDAEGREWSPALSNASYGAGVYKTWNSTTDDDQYMIAVHNCDDFEARRTFDETRRKPSMSIGEFATSDNYLKGVLLDARAQRGALAYHIATAGLGFSASDFDSSAIFPLADKCSMQSLDAVKEVAGQHQNVLISQFENLHSGVSVLDELNGKKYMITHTVATVPEREGSLFFFNGPRGGGSVFRFGASTKARTGLFPIRSTPIGPDRTPGRAAEKKTVFYDSSMPFHPRLPFEYANADMHEMQSLGWDLREGHDKYACKMLMVPPPDVDDFSAEELFAHARQNGMGLVPIPRKSTVVGSIVNKIPSDKGMSDVFHKHDANFFYVPIQFVNDVFQ